jgi:NADH-quinone oxidoreductase subunit K
MSLFQVLFAGVVLVLGIGLYGLLASRHLIKIIIALQILVKAALLAIIAAGIATGQLISPNRSP